jgi:FkbM family methyltransferase
VTLVHTRGMLCIQIFFLRTEITLVDRQKRAVVRGDTTYVIWDSGPDASGWSFWDVFADRTWEPDLERMLSTYLNENTTFLDIGAWIGPVSLMASKMCGRVHAVEPDPVARQELELNVSLQRKDNITIHGFALTDHDGSVTIGHRGDREFGDSMTSTIFSGDGINVSAVTLEKFVQDVDLSTLGLVKIDIEGGEEALLQASSETLYNLGVPVLLSTHGLLVSDLDQYLKVLDQALAKFDVSWISGSREGLGTLLAIP